MIEELQKALKEDKELYFAYQANIAMAIFDEICRRKKSKKYLNSKDLHEACNEGAKSFLDLLVK